MAARHRCTGKVWSDIGHTRIYKCSRNATIERDSKWYCWQHDPERMKVDKEKRLAARLAKADGLYTRRARNAKLAALVTVELAELLERISEILPAWGNGAIHRADLDKAKGLAARIREALEVIE